MTVSNSNIWKSSASAVRQPHDLRGKNLHIGKTLRDLYFAEDMPVTEGAFSDLLTELEASEKASGSKDH